MEDKVKSLELEIEVLKQKVSVLEAKERNRKIFKMIKIIIAIVLLVLIFIFGYKLYQQLTNYYNQIKDVIDNPLKSILNQ